MPRSQWHLHTFCMNPSVSQWLTALLVNCKYSENPNFFETIPEGDANTSPVVIF